MYVCKIVTTRVNVVAIHIIILYRMRFVIIFMTKLNYYINWLESEFVRSKIKKTHDRIYFISDFRQKKIGIETHTKINLAWRLKL